MTANHEHTPTTEQIKRLFVAVYPYPNPDEAFERWLADRDSEVEAAAEQRALREAAESNSLIDYMYGHFYNHPDHSPAAVRAAAAYLHDRADRIAHQEGDEE